jgi:GAF domain
MGRSDRLAMPPGADVDSLTRFLNQAHDHFVGTGQTDLALRRVVADSWRRSVRAGLDPESSIARIEMDDERLIEIRATHPLSVGMPVIRRLLVDSLSDAGMIVAVSDAAGQLLWVEGDPAMRARAEGMHFLPGADWSEESAGTNAPGTALALDAPVQFLGPEHLVRQVTPWSCAAAPIHDTETGAMLGVLDITGGNDAAAPQTLALVRATAAAVEAEIRLQRLTPRRPTLTALDWARPRLAVLGLRSAQLRLDARSTSFTPRHSEILVLLAESIDGLTASELAIRLSETEQADVTIRAELSRLRNLLDPLRLDSRPYRLSGEFTTDLADVGEDLAAGRLRRAVATYRGPLLPHSQAPGVVELREDLHAQVRARLLVSDDADALLAFADTPHGHDDLEIWSAALDALPTSSPRRVQVAAHVARLDALFG